MNIEKQSDEVFYAIGDLITIARQNWQFLRDQAARNPRKIARLCTHRGVTDTLHEMIIVNLHESYLRPHKNTQKPKSFLILEGTMDVVMFSDTGDITGVHRLGEIASGKPYYFRLHETKFHTLRFQTPFVVFQETTIGPFAPTDTVYPSWAPELTDPEACKRFTARLDQAILGYFP